MASGKKTVWDINLEVGGKDVGVQKALCELSKSMISVQNAGKNLSKNFKSFTQNATKLAVGVTAGAAVATTAVIAAANSFANTGTAIQKTADAVGMGVEAYQQMQYAMKQSGISTEEFDGALQKFNLTVMQGAAGNAASAKQLEEIGLSAQKLAGMKPEQAMMRLSDYMKALPSEAARTRAAVTLFGKAAGPQMMQAMKQGSAGLSELMKASEKYFTFTEENIKASRDYQNAQDNLKESIGSLKNQFISGAIGPLIEAFKTLSGAVLENMPAIKELGAKFGQWLGDAVKRLPEIIAKIKEFFAGVKNTAIKIIDFVGGWKNLAKIIAGIAIAPTFISGLKTVFSLGNFIQVGLKAIPNILSKIGLSSVPLSGALLPIIGIIAAIALVVYTVVRNFGTLKTYALDCIERIKSAFGGATGGMTVDWQKVGEVAKTVLGVIMSILESGVLFAIKTVMNLITSAIQVVIGAFKVLWNVVKLIFWPIETVIKVIIGLFTGGWSGAIEALGGQFGKLGDIFAGIFGGIKTMIGGVVGFWTNYFKDGFTFVKELIDGFAEKFGGVFNVIKEKIESFVNFFKEKTEAVKNFFGGIGDKISGFTGGAIDKFKSILPGHAEGGIFTHRHIAEIAERGAEAVVPLNNSPQGFDIWKQAGQLGGYADMMRQKTQTASTSSNSPPPVMQAAAQRMLSSENNVSLSPTININVSGNPDKETINQLSSAGIRIADDLEKRFNDLFENRMRNQRRVAFA
jgi:phage-related protein